MHRRLCIDVREACQPHRAGKGRWTAGFVEELLQRGLPLTLLSDTPPPVAWHTHLATVRVIPRRGVSWHVAVMRELLHTLPMPIFVSPTSYLVPALIGNRTPCIPVIHDLIAFDKTQKHDCKAIIVERCTLFRVVRTAAHLCAVSQATAAALRHRYPFLCDRDITVIEAGPQRPRVSLSEPDGRTILCIGTLSPRKNQARLIHAYAKLPEDLREQHTLLLAGARGWHDDEIVALAANTPGVRWMQYVSDEIYDELLDRCTVFALPSCMEGLGMQILDALQRGIPVLTSDRGGLREVTGSAALIVDPEDISSIARGLERLLRDTALRARLRAEGPQQASHFSWKRTVDLFLGCLERLAADSQTR